MDRFRRSPTLALGCPGGGVEAWVADRLAARLLGLAGLPAAPPHRALVIPDCTSVHTFGMRFPLDVAFLAWEPRGARVLALRVGVPPCRVVRAGRRLSGVAALELPGGAAARLGIREGTLLVRRTG